MEEEGHDMSNFDYIKLPTEEVDCGVRKGKKRSNTSESKKKTKLHFFKKQFWELQHLKHLVRLVLLLLIQFSLILQKRK